MPNYGGKSGSGKSCGCTSCKGACGSGGVRCQTKECWPKPDEDLHLVDVDVAGQELVMTMSNDSTLRATLPPTPDDKYAESASVTDNRLVITLSDGSTVEVDLPPPPEPEPEPEPEPHQIEGSQAAGQVRLGPYLKSWFPVVGVNLLENSTPAAGDPSYLREVPVAIPLPQGELSKYDTIVNVMVDVPDIPDAYGETISGLQLNGETISFKLAYHRQSSEDQITQLFRVTIEGSAVDSEA